MDVLRLNNSCTYLLVVNRARSQSNYVIHLVVQQYKPGYKHKTRGPSSKDEEYLFI